MKPFKMMMIVSLTATLLVSATTARMAVAADTSELLASHELTSFDGGTTSLSAYRGEVLVVNFWASWCAPCRKELLIMNEWNATWAGRGARVVAISIDKELRNAQRFAQSTELSMTVFHDGPSGLARDLDLPSLPCTFVLDQNGKVVEMISSSSSKELARIQRKVESLIATRPVVQKAAMGTADINDGESP